MTNSEASAICARAIVRNGLSTVHPGTSPRPTHIKCNHCGVRWANIEGARIQHSADCAFVAASLILNNQGPVETPLFDGNSISQLLIMLVRKMGGDVVLTPQELLTIGQTGGWALGIGRGQEEGSLRVMVEDARYLTDGNYTRPMGQGMSPGQEASDGK